MTLNNTTERNWFTLLNNTVELIKVLYDVIKTYFSTVPTGHAIFNALG